MFSKIKMGSASDFCSTSHRVPPFLGKHICPVNKRSYSLVSPQTIKHHINKPWLWQPLEQGYYFCSDPDCPVVYFGQDNSVIKVDALRTTVGIKSHSESDLLCYCYGITKAEVKNNPLIRQFVLEEKKHGNCACQARNPSGKCCLADFPKGR